MTRYSISPLLSSIGLVEGYTVTGTMHNERNEVIKTITMSGKSKPAVMANVHFQLNAQVS